MKNAWEKITENLRKSLDSGIFRVWVSPLRAEIAGNELRILAPNAFMKNWIQTHIIEEIKKAAASALGLSSTGITINILIRDDSSHSPSSPEKASSLVQRVIPRPLPARQNRLPMAYGKSALAESRDELFKYSFDDFVVGKSNQLAVAAARDLCRPKEGIQTLFVNANSGLGKTHLAQAIGREINKTDAVSRVCYLPSEKFASLFVNALRNKSVEDFKEELGSLDVLLLEDVHFFQGKEKMQALALSLIKNIQERGGKVIFTSSFSPKELQKVDRHLVSHFCSGIIAGMEAPDQAMRCEILQRKARIHQVMLPDELCELLASRLTQDIRQLESCLNNMIFKARLLNLGLDMDLAMDMLSQYDTGREELNLERIIGMVCECYGLKLAQLFSRSRRAECVLGRNTAFYLARKYTGLSLQEIGDKFNRRHSTVLKGITNLEKEMCRESVVGNQVKRVVTLIERNAGVN